MPPLTPVPLYVPVPGLPPVSAKGAALLHTEKLAGQLTAGAAVTFIVNVQVDVQPPDVTE